MHQIRVFLRPVFYGLTGLALTASFASQAATATVNVSSSVNALSYSPPSVTINVGDAVQWVWNGSASHSATSDATPVPLWDTGLHITPFTSPAVTFGTAGTFPYHCSNPLHSAVMKGSVVVQSVANTPPTVTVTNPPDGKVLSAPANITLAATASDPDGSVTSVQFLQGNTSLTNETSSPYSVVVSNLGAGDYTFSAVATDNGGLKATNAIMVHVVTPVAVVLSAPLRVSASAFQFSYTANTGLSYIVLRSGILPAFSPLATNIAINSTVTYIDNSASAPMNYYRVQRVPNP